MAGTTAGKAVVPVYRKGDKMTVLYGIIWCTVILGAELLTVKCLFPRYACDTQTTEDPEPPEAPEDSAEARSPSKDRALYLLIAAMALLAAACGVLLYLYQTELLNVGILLVTMAFLAAAALVDYKYYKIPNLIIVGMLLARAVFSVGEIFVFGWDVFLHGIIECAVTAILGMLFLLGTSKLTHGGIGFGDIKLMGALGLICGLRTFIYSLLFGMLVCALVSAVLLLVKKKKLKDQLPMAPFIFTGVAVSILLGVC